MLLAECLQHAETVCEPGSCSLVGVARTAHCSLQGDQAEMGLDIKTEDEQKACSQGLNLDLSTACHTPKPY